jgi:phage gpG-like protein
VTTKTRSGRKVNKAARFRTKFTNFTFDAWGKYAIVGAGILYKSIHNITDLQAMKYNQTMLTADKQEWKNAVEMEHKRMIENKVWEPINNPKFPRGQKY